ncbi:MAG: hypothetical protein QXW47_10175 [Candidatus Jordarchaeales archaeon]
MKKPIKMIEKTVEKDKEEVKNLTNGIITELSEYLKGFVPQRESISKHSIMGPVGKLLSVIESGRFENKEALIGYLINIHNNTSMNRISKEGLDHVKCALDELEKLRSKVDVRTWLRLLREIDYAVYKNKMEQIISS